MAQSRLGGIGGRSALRLAAPQRAQFRDDRNAITVKAGRTIPSRASSGGGGDDNGRSGNAQRSNTEAAAEMAAMDNMNADRGVNREALKQAKLQTKNMQDARLADLSDTARGVSQRQQDNQTRQFEMAQQRDEEKEKQRFKSTAQLMGSMSDRAPDKQGNYNFEQQDMAMLNDMIPNMNMGDYIDRGTGKMRQMFARLEPSGEKNPDGSPSEEQVFAFYASPAKGEEGMPEPIRNGDGPVRINTKNAQDIANIWKLDQEERTGFPGTQRQARQEEANIRGTDAKAIKDIGEGRYAAAGKPKAGTQFTEKDRRKALNDNRKEYHGMLATLREYKGARETPPPAFISALQDLEDEMAELKGMAIPAPGDAAPEAAPQAAPQQQRQRATNPKTGEVIEWDGQAWVPVQ